MPLSGVLSGKSPGPGMDTRSLPEGYGTTMAALLPRDTNWMFLYWEITPNVKAGLAREHGADIFVKSRPAARVYDNSVPERDGPGYFDVPIMPEAGGGRI